MKHIIVGDTHGKACWKQISNQPFDKFIFVGDYVDSFDISGKKQLENLKDIIQFKKDNPDKVVLLLGNHDLPYFSFWKEQYSGYQLQMKYLFQHLFEENIQLFQMCYQINKKTIVSHAGITKTWLKKNWGKPVANRNIEQTVNDLWKFKPRSFRFSAGENYSEYGDDITQSPVWVRPNSLAQDGINMIQIVGHTRVKKINHPQGDRAKFYLIDVLDSSKEYLVVEDGNFEIKQIK